MCWLVLICLLGPGLVVSDKTIHVVFSNHLDIGFDNIEPYVGYDSNVLNMYFNRYLPLAVENADWMHRVSPFGDRYVYTTHAYLLSLFLDCPPHMGLQCPGPFTRSKVVHGIQSGAITWHAHPHNAQYELYDPSLLEFSVDLVHDLDRRFGFKPKHTIILRDVPGLTRAVIPVLAAKGIKAVSVGVNPGSAPPAVPQYTPFIWRDEASGTQLLAFWRPGGYGGIHGGVNLDPHDQCIQAPGLDHVLCTAWRNDNAGPPLTVLEPLRIYQLLRQEWGGLGSSGSSGSSSSSRSAAGSNDDVLIKASSFDAFVDAVLEALPRLNLTVVTGEIGDTWVFGVQSDPLKTANFRAASRARAACIADPACPSQGASFYNFSRLLVKVPEHTWGVDIKKTLHDWVNFSNPDFYSCLPQQQQQQQPSPTRPTDDDFAAAGDAGVGPGGVHSTVPDDGVPLRPAPCPNYEHCLHAWDRQAAYIDWALQALPTGHPVLQAYAADQAARNKLAAVSSTALLVQGAVKHTTAAAPFPEAPATWPRDQGQHQFQGQLHSEEHMLAKDHSSGSSSSNSSRHLHHLPENIAWRQGLQKPQQQQQQQQQQQRKDQPRAKEAHNKHNNAGPGRAPSGGIRQYSCGSWRFELDEAQGGLTSLQKLYGQQRTPGVDWAAGRSSSSSSAGRTGGGSSSRRRLFSAAGATRPAHYAVGSAGVGGVLGQLRYSAYCEASYEVIWKYYAWKLPLPWWFEQDFSGRVNSSRAWDKEIEAVAHLEEVFETFAPASSGAGAAAGSADADGNSSTAGELLQLSLRYSFPQELVEKVGAPPTMWTVISCPSSSPIPSSSSSSSSVGSSPAAAAAAGDLEVAVVWQGKAPTRLPEAIWLSFQPAPSAVDPSSWNMHKLSSLVSPMEVILNGSQSMHAVSEAGVSVTSADGVESLQIKTWDASLVSPGKPTVFPNGVFAPCMDQGMHFNLVNNVWGTNYVMWVPYTQQDVNLAFRFSIHAEQLA